MPSTISSADNAASRTLPPSSSQPALMPPHRSPAALALPPSTDLHGFSHLSPYNFPRPLPSPQAHHANALSTAFSSALGVALTDTPLSTAPSSPQIRPRGASPGVATPSKRHATTLAIPGLTKSSVSPDGRIAERDVGSKLIIVMVGLPARGKSYIVKKIARYMNWLQHPTRIFNVGDRRRVAAGGSHTIPQTNPQILALRESVRRMSMAQGTPAVANDQEALPAPTLAANIHVNGESLMPPTEANGHATAPDNGAAIRLDPPEPMDQDATFFDPENVKAFQLREQVALETLDECLTYVLREGGSVGILDATNSTRARRRIIMDRIRKCDASINVLFLESRCEDKKLLEANMRLKLSGPDYKDQDPRTALHDFQQRVMQYEKTYQPLGEHEESLGMPYCSMIDVGRKFVVFQPHGFLINQTITYLTNFNLAPRQIWLTRHGESMDNLNGKIGGDSDLSPAGRKYAEALAKFVATERTLWEERHLRKQASTHFPPLPGDTTPPNPEYTGQTPDQRNFCVWTSMLKRSIQSAAYFSEEDFDIKEFRMLDELNAGFMEGMTYGQIKEKYTEEYGRRKQDKLHYRYPGPGGEGYLDVINRLGKLILEIERMTDHVLIVGHRSIIRVLLAYFKGLKQEDISDLDVPLGVLYMLEPKPYGVDFKAYRFDQKTEIFRHELDYQMRRAAYPSD